MSSKDIIILVAALALAGVSLYRKYLKRNKAGGQDNKTAAHTTFPSSKKDDDYEPYSKR